MLFNSYSFILFFLPLTLLGFFALGMRGLHRTAIVWVIAASICYYGWWNPPYLLLLVGSVLFNFAIGTALTRSARRGGVHRAILVVGVAANLGTLAYFKYANFFIENLNHLTGTDIQFQSIALPLAISFFTFQQIAFLVDTWRGETGEYRFLHYAMFVTFFPQLIAGPIVHHREIMPQLARKNWLRPVYANLSVGITIFVIGLAKKVLLADSAALYATPVFEAADTGLTVGFVDAWSAALAYSFQLYFDFSGYSDMAVGLARMFGVRLPVNFNSPYKAPNIIEFWRRWHITLSRFLRNYLYIPLGGNRHGRMERYRNLMITMLLGGLWHGASWTFVAWGLLHGAYLCVNHAWRHFRTRVLGHDLTRSSAAGRVAAGTITFLAVVIAWVLFRAETFGGALSLVRSMFGLNGFQGASINVIGLFQWGFLCLLVAITWFVPNSQELVGITRVQSTRHKRLLWSPSVSWALGISVLSIACLMSLAEVREFLYYNF